MTRTPIVRLGRVESTQDELRERLALAPAGAVLAVAADEQVAGRGRDGRRWEQSPGAAIAISVGRHGPLDAVVLVDLPRRVAQAVLARLLQLDPELGGRVAWKAPNDIVDARDGSKLAGVLVDARSVGHEVREVLVGVGINVAGGPFTTEDGRRATTVAHLAGHEVDHERLLAGLADAIAAELSERR